MSEIMRERLDLFLAERERDFRHRGHGAARSDTRLEVAQRLREIVLALAGDAGDGLGSGLGIGMA